MHGTSFIGNKSILVPDIHKAKSYYDELLPVLGSKACYTTVSDFSYGPDVILGTQLFFF